MKKIVLAGGTGFLGSFLASRFKTAGYEVIIISRNTGHVLWKDKEGIIDALNGADMVINLAGKSVDCRYNEKNRREILESRIGTTKAIGEAIQKCSFPPKVWINSSTATIYRHAEDRPMTEATGEIGSGFSVNVATQWEKSFFDFELPGTRKVALRMAIVLGKDGGVMQPLKKLAQLGLGGKQGKGTQMFSWIHIEDVYEIMMFVRQHENLDGVFNCSSPNPVTNEVFMQALRKPLKQRIGLPTPEWLLKIGAVVIRTETELILKSRWVVPDRLIKAGYNFHFPRLENALINLLA
ncbi:MAG: TIGR01777 family oxidoreductase [Flavisolibacter sp.]